VYKIAAPLDEGINVNNALSLRYAFRPEREFAYQGGIPAEWITEARPTSWLSWRGPWVRFGGG
jgi:hypothetical protein